MSYIYETKGICRDFIQGRQTIHALKDINIKIEEGTFTILRGTSGSGKTTLMNILGGLDRPTSGQVLFDKKEITTISDAERDMLRRKNIGFVFQSVALISVMDAYENVEFGLRVSGALRKDWKQLTRSSLIKVGLEKRMNHKPFQLSGGEQQRVAISRAIANKPRIVFADEPTAELDTHLGLQIVKLFKTLVTESGLTIVMTTHDPSMIEIADHVISLEDGEVIDER
ncbi:MAG: ABC transporter ATP-binding protein [Clostridiales bacterium]|nr:ABC transporter ATP-binding protein [Clostridiales bacterium]